MKKLFILAGAVAISSTLFAQKPTSEVKYSLEGTMNYDGTNGLKWNAPNLRMRYFVNDNIAARVQVGLGDGVTPSSEKYTFSENADGSGALGSQTIKRSAINLGIGAEYHLSGTDKMSPYFFGGLNFGTGSYKETWDNSDGTDYVSGLTGEIKAGISSFGLGLGAGFDYYIAENIYMGLEMGLNWGKYTEN
ncbi:MAG TPA: hypothetical protein DEF82_01815, partial [Crocinitomicaceae bacterium]|nr:hypothetical protein [Crocinitomicaceae bacterium]